MNSQTPARLTGSASMSFQNPVYVVSCASVVGKKEGEGPLGSKFDLVCEEPMCGEDTGSCGKHHAKRSSRIGPWKSRTYSRGYPHDLRR